jgi:hypothetical protein
MRSHKVQTMREDSRAKAIRILGEGRVTIRRLSDDVIEADVLGDSARLYVVTWTPAGWACPCDALTRCSHIRAVQLVVLVPEPTRREVLIG